MEDPPPLLDEALHDWQLGPHGPQALDLLARMTRRLNWELLGLSLMVGLLLWAFMLCLLLLVHFVYKAPNMERGFWLLLGLSGFLVFGIGYALWQSIQVLHTWIADRFRGGLSIIQVELLSKEQKANRYWLQLKPQQKLDKNWRKLVEQPWLVHPKAYAAAQPKQVLLLALSLNARRFLWVETAKAKNPPALEDTAELDSK